MVLVYLPSHRSMSQSNASLSPKDLSITACYDSKTITSPIPLNILTLNRDFHELVVRSAYHTIILNTLSLLYRFRKVVGDSPHLAYFVQNLWIGTSHLKAFRDWGYGHGSAPFDAVGYILSKTPMIKRLALATPLFPLEFTKLGGAIEHITIGGGAIPELPSEVKTVHIHGSIIPSRVRYLEQGTLRHIVYDLERPCRPGVIEYITQELFGNETTKSDLRLEFLIFPGVSTWMEKELSQLSADSLLEGAIVMRVRHPGDEASVSSNNYCKELLYHSSPYLAGLVVNLWIATPRRLNGFDTSNYPARAIENKIVTILSKARGLKRVAVSHEYIPRKGFPQIKHLSTSNDLFPPAMPVITSLESLHIHGLPGRNCVNTVISRFPELRGLRIDVFSSSVSNPEVSVLCARMVLLFRQRLKSLTGLKISANSSVIEMLKTGLKKTLEEDPRLCLQERTEETEGALVNRPLQDTWLVEYAQ
ncbi:hypothetical protein OPQ81_007824 [Rhizoctonia solani]|nr:hypothetical protein OPQ81_007824 [Rhizoctonia solani]